MKRTILSMNILAVALLLSSCSSNETSNVIIEEPGNQAKASESINWEIDSQQSNIRWTGHTAGVTVYSHYGDIKLSGGSLTSQGENITNGAFTVDMSSISPKDDGYSAEHPASDLVGHLSTGEFFSVEEFPTANFEVTSVKGSTIEGNLTIRGMTNKEVVTIKSLEVSEAGRLEASGSIVFNRQDYDVAWVHFLKDTVLSDDIELEITIVAKQA